MPEHVVLRIQTPKHPILAQMLVQPDETPPGLAQSDGIAILGAVLLSKSGLPVAR